MAVTLSQSPPLFAFSGNFIPLKFETDNYVENEGAAAVNYVYFGFPVTLTVGITIAIKYGNEAINFNVMAVTDDSGSSIPAGTYNSVAQLIGFFTSNYTLSRDFDISHINGSKVIFTAKQKNYGFSFQGWNGNLPQYSIGTESSGEPSVLRKNFAIWFELWCQTDDHSSYERIYENTLPITFSRGNQAELDLSDKLDDYLRLTIDEAPELPSLADPSPLTCKKTCRKYFIRYAESYGQPIAVKKITESPKFTVLLGALSTVGNVEKSLSGLLQPDVASFSKDRFLKQWQGAVLPTMTRSTQPQFLYFFNTRATASGARLKARWYFNDGGSADEILSVFDLVQYGKYAWNVRFDKAYVPATHDNKTVYKYEVWLEALSGTKLSETREYVLNYEIEQYVRYFLYMTSWGAMETLVCTGKGSSSYKLSQQEAARLRQAGSPLSAGDAVAYDISLTDQFKVNTGWLTNDELIMLRDFIISSKKYRFHKGRLLPIMLLGDTIEEKDDASRLYKQLLEYKYLISDDAFTERSDDDVEPVDNATPKILKVYIGTSGPVPVTEADVKNLPFNQPESIFEWTHWTGLTNIVILAIPATKSVHSVYDATSKETLTRSYKEIRIIAVDGTDYKIIAFQNGKAFSYTHEHQIVLKNG